MITATLPSRRIESPFRFGDGGWLKPPTAGRYRRFESSRKSASVPDARSFRPVIALGRGCAIIQNMRQLIARIDEGLHERLKHVARREGRSLNSIVIESLERTVAERDRPETPLEWKARMIAEGKVVVPPPPDGPVKSHEELLELSSGWGPVLSEQLDLDRHED